MQVKSIAECSREHSAILLTCIKLPFIFKTFVLSIFEWPLKTGLTVARKLKFLLIASLEIIISNKGITKVLIRLCRCAGWSAPLLFANPEDSYSHVKAQVQVSMYVRTVKIQISLCICTV